MISAKNYAAQAVCELKDLQKKMARSAQFKNDAVVVSAIIEDIQKAQHFAVPDGGKILDDQCKGIKGENIHLPYPIITVEFHGNAAVINTKPKPGKVLITKHLAIAQEVAVKDLDPGIVRKALSTESFDKSDFAILVYGVHYIPEYKGWVPNAWGFVIPSYWDFIPDNASEDDIKDLTTKTKGSKTLKMSGIPYPFLPNLSLIEAQQIGDADKALNNGILSVKQEIIAVLNLIEALSCKNVEEAIFQKARDKNSPIKSKIPKYETKCLTIIAPKTKIPIISDPDAVKGTHASPVMHLRMGHIRRLPTGNIWVNACIVGKPENGVLDKSYKIKPKRDEE